MSELSWGSKECNFGKDVLQETKFLEYGREKEKITLDGLYMLVAQAVKAQEIFQEINIDDEIIDNIYRDLQDKFK